MKQFVKLSRHIHRDMVDEGKRSVDGWKLL